MGNLPTEISSGEELVIYLKKNKELFKKLYGIIKIGIFGSFIRGDHSASSDIDIVIEMDKPQKNLHNFMQFKRQLEKKTARKVDVGFEHSLKPVVKNQIKNQITYV